MSQPALSAVYNLYYQGMADELGDPEDLLARFDGAAGVDAAAVAFVLEQTLGHVAHAANLRALIAPDERVDAVFAPIESRRTASPRGSPGWATGPCGRASGAPVRSECSVVTAGWRRCSCTPQVPAILMPDLVRRTPTVVSLDATPIEYDELGAPLRPRGRLVAGRTPEVAGESSLLAGAVRIVTWAAWTKRGLVERYDVPAEKVIVIPPGVRLQAWLRMGNGQGGVQRHGSRALRRWRRRHKGGTLLVWTRSGGCARRVCRSSSISSRAVIRNRRRACGPTTACDPTVPRADRPLPLGGRAVLPTSGTAYRWSCRKRARAGLAAEHLRDRRRRDQRDRPR